MAESALCSEWLQHARASPGGRRREQAPALHIAARRIGIRDGGFHRKEIPRLRPAPAKTAGEAETRGTPLGMTTISNAVSVGMREATVAAFGPRGCHEWRGNAKHVCRASAVADCAFTKSEAYARRAQTQQKSRSLELRPAPAKNRGKGRNARDFARDDNVEAE
jgi:hypothetical protein